MSFQRILVGTDLSEPSGRGVRAAAGWAERLNAELTVVHSYDPAPPAAMALLPGRMWPMLDAKAHEERLRSDLASSCEAWLGRVAPPHLDIVANPSAAVAICDHAKERRADLVVVGTHGRTGLARLLVGSVAEHVVRYAPAPVLVVRGEPAQPFPSRVLVGTDLSPAADAAIELARKIAVAFGAEITLAHVYDDGWWRDRLEQSHAIDRELAAAFNELHRETLGRVRAEVLRGDSAVDTLNRYAADHGIDLIILATHGLTGLDRLVIGSVAERVTRHAPCSVLVARAEGRSWVC